MPNSRLILKSRKLESIYVTKNIKNRFKKNNINLSKLILERGSHRKELLETYNKIDVALDPFPYSGGTTSFESTWMGVPVLTKRGFKFVSRSTESINHNLGMSDWIAKDENEYLAKAIKFASDVNELAKIRKNLRKKTLKLPSFNTVLFAEEFNKAIWKIWNNFIKQDK